MRDIAIDIPINLETAIQKEVCIYKVPMPIRMVRQTAYTPQVISIGLIHWNNRDENMELQKKRYLKEFYSRLANNSVQEQNDFRLELVTKIRAEKQNIINCYEKNPNNVESIINRYENNPNIVEDELVKMIFLDAVFIMELFLRSRNPQDYGNDFIIARPWLRAVVQKDLLLLENQLPFDILNKLYNCSRSKFEGNYESSFLKLACEYFSACGPRGRAAANIQGAQVLHFTDVVRHFWSKGHPSGPNNQNQDTLQNQKHDRNQNKVLPQNQILPSAKDLYDHAGVKFRLLENALLLDVTFKKKNHFIWKAGELRMSYIIIDDTTEGIVRNVMALEQCYYPKEAYVCNYFTLLDHLINTAEDVNLLVEAKIIINRLGDNALVANMINQLCQQTVEDANCYHLQFRQLNDFYRSKCNRRWATLKRVYFKDTWTSTATIVAAFVVVLQIAQTFSSIWQITHGSNDNVTSH